MEYMKVLLRMVFLKKISVVFNVRSVRIIKETVLLVILDYIELIILPNVLVKMDIMIAIILFTTAFLVLQSA